MEVINVEQNYLWSQCPPAQPASNLDGRRSELMLPKVSQLAQDDSQNYGESWGKSLLMCEKKEGDSLKSANNNSSENNKRELKLHSSQVYNLQNPMKTKQQSTNNGVVFKGSSNKNVDLFYVSQGSKSKARDASGYDDHVNDENRSSRMNNTVHRAPVPRQDSVAFDFMLGSPNETFRADVTEIQRLTGHAQEEEVILTRNNKNVTGVHRGVKETSHSPNELQRQNPAKQIILSDADPTSPEYGKMVGKNQFFSKSLEDSEWGFADKAVQEMCNQAGPEHVNMNKRQSEKKQIKSYSFANFDNSNESKNSDSTKQNKSNFGKDSDTVWTKCCWYTKFCCITVVMVMLVYLHIRVAALERSVVSSATRRCQCDKTIVTQTDALIDEENGVHVNLAASNLEETQARIIKYFDHENSYTSADGETTDVFKHPEGKGNIQQSQRQPTSKSDPRENRRINRMQTKNHNLERYVESKSMVTVASTKASDVASKNVTDQSLPSNGNRTGEEVKAMQDFPGSNLRAVETFPKINEVRRFELNEVTQETTGHKLSRRRRSPLAKKTLDPQFRNKQKRQQNQEGRNTSPQVESFHIPFWSEFFNYTKHFIRQDPSSKRHDCTTQHLWGHGIEACKDSSIIFPEKHSILPFYRPTSITAKKGDTKRMIHVDANGRFVVNISGDYLFQQNITIQSHSERHFLALYLNEKATLACQHGGFLCPDTNDEHTRTYKVCNIFGVLELRKGDILDIRTMESHMTVHAEVHYLKKSHIKFILLNKIK